MSTEGYNGWTNFETWQAALWLDGAFEGMESMSDESFEEFVKDTVRDILGDCEGLLGDIVGAWFRRVDWEALMISFKYN